MTPVPRSSAYRAAVKSLLAALKAVPAEDWGPSKPFIDIGRKKTLDRETVIIGTITGDQEWVALGGRTKDEDFRVALFVLVANPAADGTEALDRAYDIFGVIETVLREDKAIAREDGIMWQEMKTPKGTPTIETNGRGYVIESAVRFRSRI